MPSLTIVLAHGIFGFGNLTGLPTFINYFNGVAAHLRKGGHTVMAPQVNPVGSVAQRGEQLGAAILRQASVGEKVHIIAHSMGGLDARHAITHVAGVKDRVASLVTIGTSHRGSPMADAIANRTDPLFAHIPAFLVDQLHRNAGALHDLTTGFGAHFDESTPDVRGVRYLEVAGDASRGGTNCSCSNWHRLSEGLITRSTTALSGNLQHFVTNTTTSTIGLLITLAKLAGALRSHRPQHILIVTMLS